MSYDQQTWINGSGGGTPRSAARYNHMETGIKGAHDLAEALARGIATPVVVTYAASVTLNAALGSLFRITATGNLALPDPVNGTDGQAIVVEVLASGADRTVSFPSGSISPVTVPSGQVYQALLRYNAGAATWRLDDGGAGGGGATTAAGITDFTEAVQDVVAALLGAGSNVTLSYNDAAGTLTVSAAGAGTGLDAESVRDAIGVAMVGVGNIAVTVNDAADTITISTTATANSTDAQLRDRATHTGTQAISTVSGLQAALDAKAATSEIAELARDALAAALVAGSGVTIVPNDAADTITISASGSGYSDEQAQDATAALLAAGTHSGVAFSYSDAGGALSATVSGGTSSPTAHPSDANLFSFGSTAAVPATAPGAPTITGVSAGSGQVTVTFSPPASNGGAAVSSYTVTASPGGATGTGPSSPIAVTGLTNGTAYTFTVKATNSAGTGPASSASSPATPTAAGADPLTPGASTPARWWIPFGAAPHCRATWETGVVSGQCRVVWVASMPDVRARTSKLETGVAAQTQDAYQAYIQDLSTGNTVADSGVVLGTATTWTATSFTPVGGRRYKGWARVRAADGQWSTYSGTRFVAPTGVTRYFEDYGMVGDGTTRSGTDYGTGVFSGPLNAVLAACNPGDVLKSNAPGTVLTASVSGTALTAGSSVFTSGMVGQKVMVYGAGRKDGTGDAYVHRTTITAQSGTGATLALAAPTAVTGAKVVVGYKEYWIGKLDIDQPANMRGGVTIDGTGCLFTSKDANYAGFRTANGVTDNTYLNVHFWSSTAHTRGGGLNNNTGPFFVEGSTTVGHRLLGCYAEHARDAGFLLYGAAGGGPSDCHIVDCVADHTMADPFHVTGTATDIQFIRTLSVFCGDDGVANIGYRSDGDSARPQRITWESPTMLGQDWGRGLSFGGSKDCLATDVTLDRGAMASFIIGSDGDMANTEHVQVRRFTVTNPKLKVNTKPVYSQGSGTGSTIIDDAPIKLLNAASPTRQRDILLEDGTITDPGFAVQILSYGGGEFEDGTIIIRGITLAGTVSAGTNWRDEATYPNHLDLRGITVPAGSTPASAPTGANS